jgi:Toastrack DUF4097
MKTAARSSLDHVVGAKGLVSIRVGSGEIRLQGIDGDSVSVRETSGRALPDLFSIETGEESLALDARGRHRAASLDVELPRRATVVIESVSAGVDGMGLLGDQRLRTTSGEVTLLGAGGRIAIEAVSGDVDVVATEDLELTIRTVSGDIGIRASTISRLSAASTSGDVKVAGRLHGSGPFSIETVSGDATLAPAGAVRVETSTLSGELLTDLVGRADGRRGHRSLDIGKDGPLLTFHSMSGDLRVVATPATAGPAPGAVRPAPDTVRPAPDTMRPGPAADGPPIDPVVGPDDDAGLRILRALERGEIDVAEAGRRFETLDRAGPADASGETVRSPVVESADD